MKIKFFLFTLLSLFIIGCKTPPVKENNTIFNLDASYSFTKNESDAEIQVYFPSFLTEDLKKNKIRMVQGDGTVVILPNGKTIIIDCFDPEGGNDFVNFIKYLGISKIDYLISTHNHKNHFGSVPILIKNFAVDNYYWNGVHFNTEIDKTVS